MQILVEGWRFSCHSYSIINQFQLREILTRLHLQIFHQEMPYINDSWKTEVNWNDPLVQSLKGIPEPEIGQKFDHVLRFYCPWNFQGSPQGKTWVFAVTEWGIIDDVAFQGMGVKSLAETAVNSEVMIITPSYWSKKGFIRSGVEDQRIFVIPHGFDPHLYYPLLPKHRTSLRRELNWDQDFIFLNLGGCIDRKGIRNLLKAFAVIAQKYPQAKLALKASQLIYSSHFYIERALEEELTETQKNLVLSRLIYIGQHLSYTQIANLYNASDVYISPYIAEGFNLPVLEAIACGLPIICTEGGPTDDFTHPDFTLKISSQLRWNKMDEQLGLILHPDPDHLISLMEQVITDEAFRQKARQTGPIYVKQHFTWKQVVDQLLDVLATFPVRGTIEKSGFQPIIL